MALSFKLSLEGVIGKVYHSSSGHTGVVGMLESLGLPLPPLLRGLVELVVFNVVADTWFYFVHRLFHQVEWLYRNSHYLHHSSHPVNTFIGNGGDVLELVTQGEMQVFVPPLFVPISATAFLLNAVLIQNYVLLLHNGQRYKLPGFLRRYIVDPYEHNIHHYYGYKNFNFGLYLTFWDRVMGTHKPLLPVWEKASKQKSDADLTPGQKESKMLRSQKTVPTMSAVVWASFQQVMMISR